jgi:hypothetical protein
MSDSYFSHTNPTFGNHMNVVTASNIKKNLENIIASREPLIHSQILFCTTTDILPIDCDHAVDSINNLRKPLDNVSRALEENDPTLLCIPKRYRLLNYIYSAHEHINCLPRLLMEYRSLCFDKSKKKIKLQQEIRHHFILLVRSSEQLEKTGEVFLDEIFLNSESHFPLQ